MSNHPAARQKATPPPAAGPAEPFDANALLAEIQANARTFELGDPPQTFALPAPTAWPDRVLERANEGDIAGAGRAMLGDDEYDRFVDAGGNGLFLQHLVERVHGVGLGESSASSRS